MRPRVLLVAGLSLAAVPIATAVLTSQGSSSDGPSEGATAGVGSSSTPSLSVSPSSAPSSAPSDPGSSEPTGSGDELEEQVVPAQRAQRVGAPVPQAPRELRLPGEGWVGVEPVGTGEQGELAVPGDVDTLGWWEGGSRVGDPFGAMLVAGHVDDEVEGLGPSAAMLTFEQGDRVQVRAGGRTEVYVVRSLRLVPRADVEEHPELFASDGPPRLLMVTCAPPFVPEQGGYQDLAVIEARPVSGRS